MCNDTDWTFRSVLHAEARGYSTIQRRKLVPPSRLAENRPSLRNIEELTSWILTVSFLYFFCCPSFEFPSEPFQFKSGSLWRIFQFYHIFIPVDCTYYFLTYSTTAVLLSHICTCHRDQTFVICFLKSIYPFIRSEHRTAS